ncbi:MAG: PEP-utilizing enzyme [Chloroflexota bacterium]|nr:PEP-utilizing enzyme [Chloroflexota bacterium]
MTGIDVRWDAPPGAFARNFRLGEWIGDPVTPLFESWLLTTMEETMHADYARLVGQPAPRPLHVIVNGWYYYNLGFLPASARAVARMLPGLLVRLARDPRRVAPAIPPLAHLGIDLYVNEWRADILPKYLSAVASAESEMETASVDRLATVVDDLAIHAGHYFTSITMVAGYGWKTEIPLAQFYRAQLREAVGGNHQQLLRGLSVPSTPAHAASSLDWYFPTAGESAAIPDKDRAARYQRLVQEREELERRARASLSPGQLARFDRRLAEAQRASRLREEQVADLTRAWPAFRRALARIGEALASRDTIQAASDVYFLTRPEVARALDEPTTRLGVEAVTRRTRWEEQRRLAAPLVLGRPPRMLTTLLDAADRALRDPAPEATSSIRGTPASPGRATGRARVIRSTDEFDRVQAGEILVCPVTTPAWTPLFARIAAVVTDVGSVAAHASIIAREYGIPAVVATGDGTTRIADGSRITVDGSAGLVLPAD